MSDDHISEHLSGHYSDDFEDLSPTKEHKKSPDLKKPPARQDRSSLKEIEEEPEKPKAQLNLFGKTKPGVGFGNLEVSKPKLNFFRDKEKDLESSDQGPEKTHHPFFGDKEEKKETLGQSEKPSFSLEKSSGISNEKSGISFEKPEKPSFSLNKQGISSERKEGQGISLFKKQNNSEEIQEAPPIRPFERQEISLDKSKKGALLDDDDEDIEQKFKKSKGLFGVQEVEKDKETFEKRKKSPFKMEEVPIEQSRTSMEKDEVSLEKSGFQVERKHPSPKKLSPFEPSEKHSFKLEGTEKPLARLETPGFGLVSKPTTRQDDPSQSQEPTQRPLLAQSQRFVDTEVQSSFETLFMRFSEFAHRNRESFAHSLSQQEQNLFYYDDGIKQGPPSSAVTVKTRAKYETKVRNYRGFVELASLEQVLRQFEFQYEQEELRPFLESLDVLEKKSQRVNYMRLIRELYRRKPQFNIASKKFAPVKTKALDLQKDPIESAVLIKKAFKNCKELRKKRDSKEVKKLEKLTESQVDYTKILEDPEKTLEFLREKVLASQAPLEQIFKAFDSNGDGRISREEFRQALQSTGVEFKQALLDRVFEKLDVQHKGVVSYMEFLAVVYKKDHRPSLFDYLSEAEHILDDLRLKVRERFPERKEFEKSMNNGISNEEKVSGDEFIKFIQNFTDRYSRIQLFKVFDFLDKNAKKFLSSSEFREIYEHQVSKQPLMKEAPGKKPVVSKEFEKVTPKSRTQESDESKGGIWGERETKAEFMGMEEKKIVDIFTGGKLVPRKSKKELEEREKMLEMEMVLKELSERTKDMLQEQGKNLRDLFNMFSKDFFGYLNRFEFERLLEFIWKEGAFNIKAMNELFRIYSNQVTRRMGFNMFLYLINLGDKINPIYLKFKFRFGDSLESIKERLYEEFQKLDSKKGTGLLNISHFEKILKTNDITLTQRDKKYLADEGFLLVKSSTETYLNYRRLLPTIFPATDQLTQELMRLAIKTIMRLRRFYKKRKAEKAAAKEKELLEKVQSQLKGKSRKKTGESSPKLKASEKDKEEKPKDPLESIGISLKPVKEIFEFEATLTEERAKSPTLAQRIVTGKGVKGKPGKRDKSELQKSTLKGQMTETLPPVPKEDPVLKEHRQKMIEFVRQLLDGCVKSAVEAGQSLLLTKEIQRKFEKRPVLKDVVICMQDLEFEVLDLLPRSLNISTDLARILTVSRENLLQELDISNGTHLGNLNLGSQIPLKSSKMLDVAFSPEDNRLYCLTDKWILEVWELHQRAAGPLHRLRVLPFKSNFAELIERAYNRRTYAGSFPQFLSFSNQKPKEILVNCSALNNSLVFIDPVSLSVSKQMFLNLQDFRVSKRLAMNISRIAEQLQEIRKEGRSFEEIFKLPRLNDRIPQVSMETFLGYLKKNFQQIQSPDELKEIAEFLDQKADKFISKDEFDFLFDLPKILNLRSEKASFQQKSDFQPQEQTYRRPPNIELTEKSLKILYRMIDFFRKAKLAPIEAFKVFDSNNSGFISIPEFNKILDQISSYSATEEDKDELVLLFDRDRNGTIEYTEFLDVYSQLLPDAGAKSLLSAIQNSPRSNLLFLFQKCYDAGLDIEAELLRLDPQTEGNLPYETFKSFLKWLPMGVLDREVEEILAQEAVFCENARVNYLSILQNPSFQQIKLKFQAKKSLIDQKELKRLMEELESQEHIYQNSQKVVVESLIYLAGLELLAYTTAFPLSSVIYISTSAKRFKEACKIRNKNSSSDQQKQEKKPKDSLFENVLLARLVGHRSSYPPTIFYSEHSGCLISGEKLEKPKTPEAGGSNNQSFLPFYVNVETSKDIFADILIWHLQRDLFENFQLDPPWTIRPTKVIPQAHYDSILDFAYLPASQLLVSCSLDRTIKIWDPVAKPHPLTCNEQLSYIKVKPGYYRKPDPEYTCSNLPFCEIKRIYTGDLVCHKLADFLQIVPVNLGSNENNSEAAAEPGTRKTCRFEMLVALELGRLQMIGNGYKRSGKLRGFFLERLQVEVEARCHDDPLPEHTMHELEGLFVERKRKAKVSLQNHLPLLLENAKSRVVLQQKTLGKIQSDLKKLSLEKFQRKDRNQGLLEQVFGTFRNLPLRPKSRQSQGVDAAELYYYLRKFHCLHPFSISKDEFIAFVAGLREKSRNLLTDFDPYVKRTPLEARLFDLLLKEKLELRDLFQGDASLSRDQLEKALEIAKINFNRVEYEEFWAKIDPMLKGSVRLEDFKETFNEALLERNLRRHAKPQSLVSKLVKGLKKDQRAFLCMNLSLEDNLHCGYLTKDQFISAFKKSDVPCDKNELLELFESYAERFSEQDKDKVLNLSFFFKQALSSNENFLLVQVFRTLGHIKACFLARGLPLDFIFRDLQHRDPLRVEAAGVQPALLMEEFEGKVMELRVPDVGEKEVKRLAAFLSLGIKERKACVGLDVFLHYLRKTQTKTVFTSSPDDYKAFNREIVAFLGKENDIKEWAPKKLCQPGDVRYLLVKADVPNGIIDELLVKLEEAEYPMDFAIFLENLRNMTRHYEELIKEEKDVLAIAEPEKPFPKITESELQSQTKTKPHLLAPKKEKDQYTVTDLFKEKSEKTLVGSRRSVIKSFKQTESLVNFVRTKAGPAAIREILQFCSKFDEKHEGVISLSAFINILKVIVDHLPNEILLGFANEWTLYHPQSQTMDYQDFFSKYFQDPALEETLGDQPAWREVDLNSLYMRIGKETASANINLNYALKFFDREQRKVLLLKDFRELLAWLKVSLSEIELQALVFDLRHNQASVEQNILQLEPKSQPAYLIDSERFTRKLTLCGQGVAPVFNEKLWSQGLDFLQLRLIEVCYRNMDFLRFLFQQKSRNRPAEEAQLLEAGSFFAAVAELKADFTLEDAEFLTKFAVVGSKASHVLAEEAKKSLSLPTTTLQSFEKQLINIEQFFESLPVLYSKKQDMENDPEYKKKLAAQTKLNGVQKELSEDAKFLLSKITGRLKDRGVSVWDAILTAGVQLSETARLSVPDFKIVLRSLDLQLSLKEKLLLISTFGDEKGQIDVQEFIKRVETRGLSENAIRALMEKLAVALFYNDMSLKRAFDCFDLNKNGQISRNEFLFGMGQLDLGLSLFEISQVMSLMDENQNGIIEKEEFLNTFQGYFDKLQIDPLKDFSMSLLAKIKSLLNIKGSDLLQCFIECDRDGTGVVDLEGLKQVLNNFGLTHIQPYELTTLIRLYFEYDEQQEISKPTRDSSKHKTSFKKSIDKSNNRKSQQPSPTKKPTVGRSIAPKKSLYFTSANLTERIDYKLFTQRILDIAERHSKSDLELTNELFRKVFRLFQLKGVSIFEGFVYFDVNVSFTLSKLELRLGLAAIDLHLNEKDFRQLWNGFARSKGLHLRFPEFMQRFVLAGALQLQRFEDYAEGLLKRFVHTVQKLGNYEEAFKKLDRNLSGQISVSEFKDAVKRNFLGFTGQEAEVIFKSLCSGVSAGSNPENKENEQQKLFGYRQFAKLLALHHPKTLQQAALARLQAVTLDKKLNWKGLVQKFLTASTDPKAKSPNEILLSDLKKLIRSVKTGLSLEEIDHVINSFSDDPVHMGEFERARVEAHKQFEQKSVSSNHVVADLLEKLRAVIERERLQVERLFFDFDQKQLGFLELADFNQMIMFLRVPSNKHQIKTVFTTVDQQKKGFITLANFRAFLEEGGITVRKPIEGEKQATMKKKGDNDPELMRIIEKIRESVQIGFEQAMKNIEYNNKQPLNEKTLGKLLMEAGTVLPNSDLILIIRKLQRDFPDKKLIIQEFLDLAIREGLHSVEPPDEGYGFSGPSGNSLYIPPQAVLGLEKLLKMLNRLEISPANFYKYLKKPQKQALSKKDLLKSLQAMDLGLLKDDLLLIHQFFDEKGFGEISEDVFLEKLEIIRGVRSQEANYDQASNETEEKKLPNFASKQQALLVLQRVSQALESRGYNRKQIKALFDKNSNGYVNREELLEGLKSLDLGIELDKLRILLEFLDKRENGVIEVRDLVSQLFESSPDKDFAGNFKEARMKTLITNMVGFLKGKQKDKVFLGALVNCEKLVRPSESFQGLSRLKIGISEQDFLQVSRENGVKLNEEDKIFLFDYFRLRINPAFLDLEAIYTVLETSIYREAEKTELLESPIESQDWEAEVYRKIADYLRKRNLSLMQAFQCIDRDGSGLISHEEFKRFIKGIEGCEQYSEKELIALVSNFANPKPGHLSYIDFREKFLRAYSFEPAKEEQAGLGNTNILSRKLKDMRVNDRQALTFLLRKFNEVGGVERAWVILDDQKRGWASLEDLTKCLQKLKVFFNRGQVGLVFNFIDKDMDGAINFMEFLDFWKLNEKVSVLPAEDAVKKERKTSLKQLEFEIFEHICRTLNQKEVSLFSVFQELDPTKRGFISPHQFVQLLQKTGVFLSSDAVEELLKILDFKSPDKIHFADLELKLQTHGLMLQTLSQPASFDFSDRLLRNFALRARKSDKPLVELIKGFDENFDGFLSTKEFFKALKLSQRFEDLAPCEFQRLAHIFASRLHRAHSSDCVEIARIDAFLEENQQAGLKDPDLYLNVESFAYLLSHFDGFNRLDVLIQELRSKARALAKMNIAQKLRGLKLIGNKWASRRVVQSGMKSIEMSLDFAQNMVRGQLAIYINNETAVRLLNPVKDFSEALELTDRQAILNRLLLISHQKVRIFTDSSLFSYELPSKHKLSAYFSHYKGFSFEQSKPLDVIQYPKETLQLVCRDGRRFEEHLFAELRAQKVLTTHDRNGGFRTDILPEIVGVFEKKLGLEASQKELYVLLEVLPESEFFSLAEVVKITGGLLRVPFLSKTAALGLILRLWGFELLEILNELCDSGIVLPFIRPENVILSRNPSAKIRLSNLRGMGLISEQGNFSQLPDLALFSDLEPEKDSYLAPELIMRSPMENSHLAASWTFGCLLYEVIFGKPPPCFFSNVALLKVSGKIPSLPSDFSYFEVFSPKDLMEIMRIDYDLDEQLPNSPEALLAAAAEQKDFAGLFGHILDKNLDPGFSDVLGVVALCLQFEPARRPSLKAMLRSKAFQQDQYLTNSARQFAANLHFFRSPSQSLKAKVLDPLKLLGEQCRKSKKPLDFSKELLEIMEVLLFSIFHAQKPSKKLDDLQKNVVSDIYTQGSMKKDPHRFPWMPKEARPQLDVQEGHRKKLPNYGLVKFLFDHEILDQLIFVLFRSQRPPDSHIFTLLRDLFRMLFGELSSYDSASSPFVDKILTSFTKLFVGEDSLLISDEVATNQSQSQKGGSLFRSLHWTPEILLTFGSLFRESISESGLGKTKYPVLQDYLNYCEVQQKIAEFQPKQKIEDLDKRLSHKVPKGFDYYRDLFTNAENLKVLQEQSHGLKSSSLRIVLSYLKGVLESGNSDKIKALVDSRTPVYLIHALNVRDAHLRTELLEVFYLFSRVYEEERDRSRPEIEEVNRTFGIITHFLQNAEDRLDRRRFLDCANDYFSLNRRVLQDYLLRLAEVFETPAIISPLFSGLKNPSELYVNKVLIIRIFGNLLQGPPTVIQNLTTASLDVFPSIFKLLANKKTLKREANSLVPEVLRIYHQVNRTCKPEVLKVLGDLPGVRALFREQELEVPVFVSVVLLHGMAQDLKDFFLSRKQDILLEIKGDIIRRNRSIQSRDQMVLLETLLRKVMNLEEKFLNWLRFYYLKKTVPLIEAWKLSVLCFELFQGIAEEIFEYGNISSRVQAILIEVASFPDRLSKLDLEFVLFNPDYEERTLDFLRWMLAMIEKISCYHRDTEETVKEQDQEVRAVIEHRDLRPYARNLLSPVSQALGRVFLRMLERKNARIDTLLSKLHFTEIFVKQLKTQYHLLGQFILRKTEDLHVLDDYVEEANIRLKTFDSLLASPSNALKRPLIETQFLQYLTSGLLLDGQCFDAQLFKSPMVFLAYREFPPLRNEGLTMLTSVIWNRDGNETLFKELLVGVSHNNLIQKTFAEVKKLKQGVLWISGVFLFSVLIGSGNDQLIYLMKHEGIMEYLKGEFEKNSKLKNQFADIYRYVMKV